MESRQPVTPLLKTELTATAGKDIVVLLAEVPPHDTGSEHYHPGDEVVYILEGSVTFTVDGKPDVALKAGETCHIRRNKSTSGRRGATGSNSCPSTWRRPGRVSAVLQRKRWTRSARIPTGVKDVACNPLK
jgi:hypothetical protein